MIIAHTLIPSPPRARFPITSHRPLPTFSSSTRQNPKSNYTSRMWLACFRPSSMSVFRAFSMNGRMTRPTTCSSVYAGCRPISARAPCVLVPRCRLLASVASASLSAMRLDERNEYYLLPEPATFVICGGSLLSASLADAA